MQQLWYYSSDIMADDIVLYFVVFCYFIVTLCQCLQQINACLWSLCMKR